MDFGIGQFLICRFRRGVADGSEPGTFTGGLPICHSGGIAVESQGNQVMVALAENGTLHLGSGHYSDAETENYYVRNRYYSPPLGRWLARDPVGIQGGINLYEQVGSSAARCFSIASLAGFARCYMVQ
jgi:RHS repeat-associated protein